MKRTPLKRKAGLKAKTGFKRPTTGHTKPVARRSTTLVSKTPLAKKARVRKQGAKSMAKLKKELDALFSKYVRAVNPPICYTCGKTGVTLQCGHFVPRQYLATRWSLENCKPQCVGCNLFGDGKTLDFEDKLVKELGAERVAEIKASRHQVTLLTTDWYKTEIERYKSLLK